ncbi:24701_t:CDS:1, partial [Racocetra persica]
TKLLDFRSLALYTLGALIFAILHAGISAGQNRSFSVTHVHMEKKYHYLVLNRFEESLEMLYQ